MTDPEPPPDAVQPPRGAERRRHPRTRCLVSADVLTRRFAWEGTILDHSESGVFVASTAPVAIGDALDLVFCHPEEDRTVHFHGRVVRTVRPGVGRRGVSGFGVLFFELDAEPPPSPPPVDAGGPGRVTSLPPREPRYPWGVTVECIPDDPRSRIRRYRIENASRSGVYLAGGRPPRRSARARVRIDGETLGDGGPPLSFRIQVMWRRKKHEGIGAHAGAGCKITGFDRDDDRRRWERAIDRLATGEGIEHG